MRIVLDVGMHNDVFECDKSDEWMTIFIGTRENACARHHYETNFFSVDN